MCCGAVAGKHHGEPVEYRCWDVIVECWSDNGVAEEIGPRVKTVSGAIKRFKDIVSIYDDYQADAINSAFTGRICLRTNHRSTRPRRKPTHR